jgi:hypoxanthine phosphoribosyltransferase
LAEGAIGSRISEILYSEGAIQARVRELGKKIADDYSTGGAACDVQERPPVLICILHGALVFLADLVRQIPTEVEFDFICVASYGNGTSPGAVRLIKDLERPIEGRDALLVEDIIDTGYTIDYLMRSFAARKPASLRVCALLDKIARRETPVHIDYTGFVLEQDKFIVGYGMDYAELYRNLPYIAVLKPEYVR